MKREESSLVRPHAAMFFLSALVFSAGVLPLLAHASGPCSPASAKINIRADIDGRSRLIIQDNAVQWQHYDWAAPGREPAVDLPTIVDCAEWYPVWSDIPDRRNDFCGGCLSSIFTPDPPRPNVANFVGIQRVKCRHRCDVIQAPKSTNGFTLVIEFDDNPVPSSTEYEIDILLGKAATVLSDPAAPGATTIEVESAEGFAVGDGIRINPGGATEEDNTVSGIGSLELSGPLLYEHEAGETVVKLPAVPLDHFICYATKLTKGNICSESAPVNAGKACEAEEECGGASD